MTIWPAWQHYEEGSKGSIETGKLADFVILSRDPTKGDVNTIDQIKVTETIKEGETVFALTPEEQRKADLMLKPDRRGDYAFARFLRAAGKHREAGLARAAAAGPDKHNHTSHDDSCASTVLADLAVAMVSSVGATAK
jgi:hypothetical protein